MDIHQANGTTIQVDEDNIHEYTDNKHYRHGKLGQIETEFIIELQETRRINKYLFNIKISEVYYINKILTPKYYY